MNDSKFNRWSTAIVYVLGLGLAAFADLAVGLERALIACPLVGLAGLWFIAWKTKSRLETGE